MEFGGEVRKRRSPGNLDRRRPVLDAGAAVPPSDDSNGSKVEDYIQHHPGDAPNPSGIA
jgi:hypothetical protein